MLRPWSKVRFVTHRRREAAGGLLPVRCHKKRVLNGCRFFFGVCAHFGGERLQEVSCLGKCAVRYDDLPTFPPRSAKCFAVERSATERNTLQYSCGIKELARDPSETLARPNFAAFENAA